MNRNSLFWGVLILIVGSLLFLENIHVIPPGVVWPTILIFLGLWVLLGRTLARTGTVDHLAIPLDGASEAEIILNH